MITYITNWFNTYKNIFWYSTTSNTLQHHYVMGSGSELHRDFSQTDTEISLIYMNHYIKMNRVNQTICRFFFRGVVSSKHAFTLLNGHRVSPLYTVQ